MAHCCAFNVKRHNNVIRLKVAQEFEQHVGKAVDGVGGKSPGIGELRNGVKGAVNIIVAVDQSDNGDLIFFVHS